MPITKATSNVIAPITATGSTTARSLPDRFADVVNVKDFGAVGDNIADDTAAIQAAIDSFSISGGSIYLPAGTYRVTSLIVNRADVSFVGDGRSATILNLATPAGVSSINITGVNSNPVPIDKTWGAVIDGITFDATGNSNINTYTILATYAHGLNVRNCSFIYCHSGISLQDCYSVGIDNVVMYDLKPAFGIGIFINGMLDHYISRVTIDHRTPGGMFREPLVGIYVKNTGMVSIESGEIIHCRTGILFNAGSGDLIEWSHIGSVLCDQCSGTGIDIVADAGGEIRGLMLVNTWSSTANKGIRFRGGGTINGVSALGLRVYNCWKNGIEIESGRYYAISGGSRIGQNGFDQTGTCNTSGITVTLTSGVANTVFGGKQITINGVLYTIANVVSSTVLQLTTSAGVQSGVGYSVTNNGNGIYLGSNIDNVTITDNFIGQIDGLRATQEYGVTVGSGCDYILIANNQFINNNTGPVSMGSTSQAVIKNNIDVDNVIQSVASVAVIVLGINDTVKITGTTSISGIDGPRWVGRQVTFITVDGAISFTTGNNIVRAFTSVQNVPFSAVYDGTKWYLS
jgi:hypothetical protein